MPALKRGIRILAIDDSFKRGDSEALVIGIIGRQGLIEGAISSSTKIDGTDATMRIEEMVRRSKYSSQIALIVTNGITVGGLNIVDVCRLNESLNLPIVAITRKRPRVTALLAAMRRLDDYRHRAALVRKIRDRISIARLQGFYIQSIGISPKAAEKFMPDAVNLLRATHIIASGVAHGESKGRI